MASGLIQLGYSVMKGSRNADNEKVLAWAESNGENAHAGTFADAANYAHAI